MATRRTKILIVDGYNVLRSGSRYREIVEPDYTDDAYNRARETLLNDVVNFAGHEYQATIVFDAAQNAYSTGQADRIGGVRIMFSPSGSSADKVIEKLAHDARERGIETIVVTSDASIQDTVFGGGVDRMSAAGFCREVSAAFHEAKLDRAPEVAAKNTIAGRLDADTLARLKAMRDCRG